MLIENPARDTNDKNAPYCAIRRRNPDGTPRKGAPWLEPMGSVYEFIDDQQTWQVVFYNRGDQLPE